MFVEVRVDLIGWFEEVPFLRKLYSHRRCQSLSPFALRDLYIISYLFEFVKRFFKSFFKFFSKPFQKLLLLFLTRPLYYIISYAVCQEVLKNLEILFDSFRCSCELFYCFALAHSYNSIPYLPRFVKGFFEFFWNYFFHPFFTISYFQFSTGVHASYTLSVRRRLIINIIEIVSHWFIIRHMI